VTYRLVYAMERISLVTNSERLELFRGEGGMREAGIWCAA